MGWRHIPAGRTAIDAALPGCLARRLARYMARRSSLTFSPTICVAQKPREAMTMSLLRFGGRAPDMAGCRLMTPKRTSACIPCCRAKLVLAPFKVRI